jgi:hypothetical protein
LFRPFGDHRGERKEEEMMSLAQAVSAALCTPSGTSDYQAACDLAIIRGFDPNGYTNMTGLPPIMHWQRVIAETLLEQSLRDTMLALARD